VNEDTLEWCLLLPLYFQMTLLWCDAAVPPSPLEFLSRCWRYQ
jgi:hypothetical protein